MPIRFGFLFVVLTRYDLAELASVVPKFVLRHDQNAILIGSNVARGGLNYLAQSLRRFLSSGFSPIIRQQFLERLTQLDEPN